MYNSMETVEMLQREMSRLENRNVHLQEISKQFRAEKGFVYRLGVESFQAEIKANNNLIRLSEKTIAEILAYLVNHPESEE